MNDSTLYTIFGFVVLSEIPIPEWQTTENQSVDVTIKTCESVHRINHADVEKTYYQINHEAYYTHISGVAEFLVEKGTQISIVPDPKATHEEIRLFLLNRIVSILLLQRHILPLAACSLYTNNICVLLTGKSKYATSILPHYYKEELLSSYLTGINGEGSVTSGFGYVGEERLPIRHEKTYAPNYFLYLESKKEDAFKIQETTGSEKMNMMLNTVFYKDIMPVYKSFAFKTIANLATKVRIYKITIPATNFTLDKLLNNINTIIYDY